MPGPSAPSCFRGLSAMSPGSKSPQHCIHELHDPRNPRFVPPEKWCITRDDLDDFEREVRELWRQGQIPDDPTHKSPDHDNPEVGPSMYLVNQHYIKPSTLAAGGMSWALSRHEEGLECDVFVTHAWIEGVFEFTSKVRSAWPRGAKHLWVCFLANPQNSDISVLLDGSVMDSPFARALSTAKYMIVVPNKRKSIYTRLWCVLEAYIAVNKAGLSALTILMPNVLNHAVVVQRMLPGLGLFCVGFFAVAPLISDNLPDIAGFFGPGQWQVLSLIICSGVWHASRWAMLCMKLSVQQVVLYTISLAYVELFLAGVTGGLALWQFEKLAKTDFKVHMTFQPGEGTAIVLLLVCVFALHVYNIYLAIVFAVLKLEDKRLSFDTVDSAECTASADARRIKTEIRGRTSEIDRVVRMLRIVGRYNMAVKFNLDRGMCLESARDGVNPFKVACACCLWSFWWITDFAASRQPSDEPGEHIIWEAILVADLTMVLAVVAAFAAGDRAIFAIEMALWFGVGFLWVSLTTYYFTKKYVQQLNMTEAIQGLQLMCFCGMLVADTYFYSGFGKWLGAKLEDTAGSYPCAECVDVDLHSHEHCAESQDDVENFVSTPLVEVDFHSFAVPGYGSTGSRSQPVTPVGNQGSRSPAAS